MKKLSIFLCLITMFVFFPFSTGCSIAGNFGGDSSEIGVINSSDSEAQDADDFTYKKVGNTIQITGVKNTSITSANVPDKIKNLDVTSFSANAFKNCNKLQSITIPSGVTGIENECFLGCTSINMVIIKNLANWCSIRFGFSYDYNHPFSSSGSGKLFIQYGNDKPQELTEISIPNDIIALYGTFQGCNNITKVTFNSEIVVGACSFYGCVNLSTITTSSGSRTITNIGDYAFADCKKLTSISLTGVTHIGLKAFMKSGLTSVVIPATATELSEEVFSECADLTSAQITFSDRLTYIPDMCFNKCGKLNSFTAGNSGKLTNIGYRAFYECSSLNSISGFDSWSGNISDGNSYFQNCLS